MGEAASNGVICKAETVRPGFRPHERAAPRREIQLPTNRQPRLVDADILASTTTRLLFSQMTMLAGISEINDEAGQGPVQKQSYRIPAEADE